MKMIKHSIRLCLILIAINLFITSCQGLRSSNRGYGSKYESRGYKDNAKPKTLASSSSAIPNQNPSRRGLGLSAWGIVTVIVSLILAIAGLYYFSICYPILCKKTRKYDMIGLPSVA